MILTLTVDLEPLSLVTPNFGKFWGPFLSLKWMKLKLNTSNLVGPTHTDHGEYTGLFFTKPLSVTPVNQHSRNFTT